MTSNKGNRRYMPIEKYPVYNDFYDQQMLNSFVFNQGDNISSRTILWTKKNIADQMYCYTGDQEGFYYRDGDRQMAYIPEAKQKLKEIETRYIIYKHQKIDEGYEEPEEMPSELLTLKYHWEARLDVREKELLELQKRLATFIEKEQQEQDEKVLLYGLMCDGRLSDGVLVEIDQQQVIRFKGKMIISTGRFKGMAVSDYRKLSEQWQSERKKIDEAETLRRKEQAIKEGKRVIEDPTSFGGGRLVSQELLPEWPEGVKNYFEVEDSLA